jgi:starvation-inducible DNA-binding protein
LIAVKKETEAKVATPSAESGHDSTHRGAANQAAQVLTRVLADTYIVANATQVLQWNTDKLASSSLGQLLAHHRQELSGALDEIAGRIRALGCRVLGTLDLVSALSTDEQLDVSPTGRALLTALTQRHQTVVEELREATSAIDESADDETTSLLRRRLIWHEEAIGALEQASLPLWGAL